MFFISVSNENKVDFNNVCYFLRPKIFVMYVGTFHILHKSTYLQLNFSMGTSICELYNKYFRTEEVFYGEDLYTWSIEDFRNFLAA